MKVGDKVPVTIAGQVVAYAEVKEMADNTATLIVPATLVVMATRTEITNESRPSEGPSVIIDGIERQSEGSDEQLEQHVEINAEPAEATAEMQQPTVETAGDNNEAASGEVNSNE